MRLRLGILTLAALLSTVPLAAQSKLAVQKLAEGVWAASAEKGANVGWFTLGDGVVVIDAGGDNAIAGEMLKQIATTTGGKPVRTVVLTHAHADHAAGVRALAAAGAQVVCAERVAAPILGYLTQAVSDPADPLKGKRNVKPTLMTISDRLILSDGVRRAEIQWMGPAHSNGDLVVLLPSEKVLFSGDLAPNGRLPDLHLADADAGLWAKVLPRLAAAPVEKMVPGHGEIGPRQGIADSLAYLRGLDEVVQRLVKSGIREEYLDARLREADNRIGKLPISEAHLANAKAQYVREKEKISKAAAPTPGPTPRKPAAPVAKPGT
jgi:cyclase